MNLREKFILRAALIYAQSNLSDLNEAFEDFIGEEGTIRVNEEHDKVITEEEVEQLLLTRFKV